MAAIAMPAPKKEKAAAKARSSTKKARKAEPGKGDDDEAARFAEASRLLFLASRVFSGKATSSASAASASAAAAATDDSEEEDEEEEEEEEPDEDDQPRRKRSRRAHPVPFAQDKTKWAMRRRLRVDRFRAGELPLVGELGPSGPVLSGQACPGCRGKRHFALACENTPRLCGVCCPGCEIHRL
jgi:ribosomal protein L12E/L44/L45/RPP1/RPP2